MITMHPDFLQYYMYMYTYLFESFNVTATNVFPMSYPYVAVLPSKSLTLETPNFELLDKTFVTRLLGQNYGFGV